MALAPGQAGPAVVLLSPSFSRKDESIFPRALDRLSRVFGHLPYALTMKLIGPAFGSSLPPARRKFLLNELKKNDPRFLRAQTRSYLRISTTTARSRNDSATRASGRGSSSVRRTTGGSERDPRRDRQHRTLRAQPDARRDRSHRFFQAVTSATG